jgi:hypothetical protein
MFVAREEEGKGTVWAMLLCTMVTAFYLKGGKALVDSHIDPTFHLILIMIFAVITVFTIGCAIHMIFVGDRSNRELKRELVEQSDAIDNFIAAAQTKIRTFETQALHYSGVIRPQALEKVGYVRRIINALQRRNEAIKQLLSSQNAASLFDAYELSCKKLEIVENALDSLIGASPVPPIEAGEWFLVIEQAFDEIEIDLSWAYQQKASYAA